MTILLLGGTRDAIKIGESLDTEYIYSIAGVTDNPATPNNAKIHMGGFSNIGGLQKFIDDNNIKTIINATHPYASQITATVNEIAGANVIRYLRSGWKKQNPSDWVECVDENEIKEKLSEFNGNVFFALGAKTIHKYTDLKCSVISRSVVETKIDGIHCIVDKGPYNMEKEQALFDKYKFEAIVCKNSGGEMNYNKVAIATQMGIPVFILSRPIDNSKIIVDDITKVGDYL